MRAPGFLNAETKITMFSTKSRSKVILLNKQKSVKPFLTTILFCHILDQSYYHKMTSPSFVVILRNWQYVWCIFHSDHNLQSGVCTIREAPFKKNLPLYLGIVQIALTPPRSVKQALWETFYATKHLGKRFDPSKVKNIKYAPYYPGNHHRHHPPPLSKRECPNRRCSFKGL